MTAFSSLDQQDTYLHYGLATEPARTIMRRLNEGGDKVASEIAIGSLDTYDLSREFEIFHNGKFMSKIDSDVVLLVGQHFLNNYDNPSHPIFILTFFPKNNSRWQYCR